MFNKTRKSLEKTRDSVFNALSIIRGKKQTDSNSINNFEEKLLLCDIGPELTDKIVSEFKLGLSSKITAQDFMKNTIKTYLQEVSFKEREDDKILLISGVNGTGKTTSCVKLAYYYRELGKKVLVIAADTFRAAAQNQISFWCNENNIECFSKESSNDPSSVIFEGLNTSIANQSEKIIIDTAGRLHTSINLMNELGKMERVINKFANSYQSWITLDSTTGQNALNQVDLFKKTLDINGIILNKLDGSAKGGAILSIMKSHNISVKFIGVGEKIEDIIKFNLDEYIESIFDEKY